MKNFKCIFIILILASSAYAKVSVEESKGEWLIGDSKTCRSVSAGSSKDCPLLLSTKTSLKNRFNLKFLRQQRQSDGINLGWDRTSPQQFIFERISNSSVRGAEGERFALFVVGEGYIKYGKRDEGINLKWSHTPVHEWMVYNQKAARLINTAQPIGLFNLKKNDYLVFCNRSNGVSLKWAKDCTRPQRAADNSALNMAFTLKVSKGSQERGCTSRGHINVNVTSGKLIPSQGTGQGLEFNKSWDINNQICYISLNNLPLRRQGEWKFEVRSGGWTTKCTLNLTTQETETKRINFTLGAQGCSVGLGNFPK